MLPSRDGYSALLEAARARMDGPLPSNADMERGVIGAAIIGEEDTRKLVFYGLEGGDFWDEVNRAVFEALGAGWKSGAVLNDTGCLIQCLRDQKVMEKLAAHGITDFQDIATLAQASAEAALPVNVDWMVRTLRRLRCERAKLLLATDILNMAHKMEHGEWLETSLRKLQAFQRRVQ